MRPPVLSRHIYLAVALIALVVLFTPLILTSWLTPQTRASTLEQAIDILASAGFRVQSIAEAADVLQLSGGENVENEPAFDVEAELAAFVGQERVVRLLLLNSGPYAIVQMALTLAAAGILLWTFVRVPNKASFGVSATSRNYLILLLGLLLLIVLALDIRAATQTFVPENEGFFPGSITLKFYWTVSMIVYIGILPMAVAAVPRLANVVDRYHIPVASWPIGLIAILAFLGPWISSDNTQPIELLYSILFFVFAIETWWIEKHGQPQVAFEPLSLKPARAAVLSPVIYASVAMIGLLAIIVPIFLPGWLVPNDAESTLAQAQQMLSDDGIQVDSIKEAAAAMSIPEGEDTIAELAQHIGTIRSQTLLFSEDGVYETIQAALCGAAAIILLWTFFRHRTEIDFHWFTTQRYWFVLCLGLMLIVMLGEEVSWGQRLLGFNTPEWLTQRNFQGEFTFHNMRSFQTGQQGNSLEVSWVWGMIAYLGVLPLLVVLFRPLGTWTESYRFPVADWPIGVSTLVLFIINAIFFRTSEVTELILDILLVAFAIEIYWKSSEGTPKEEHQWLAFAVGIWITLWCVVTPFQSGEDALPSVRSTDLYKSALVMVEREEKDKAFETLEESLAIWPNNVRAHHLLGQLFLERNETQAAIEQFNEALRIEPRFIPSLLTLATVLSQEGQWAEAIDMFRRVIETEPDFQSTLSRRADLLQSANNVAWIMATQPNESLRDGFGAVELSKQVCEATDFRNPSYLDTFAAALAEIGEFEQAREIAQRAVEIAIETDNIGLASGIQDRLNHYQDGKPYRGDSLD